MHVRYLTFVTKNLKGKKYNNAFNSSNGDYSFDSFIRFILDEHILHLFNKMTTIIT